MLSKFKNLKDIENHVESFSKKDLIDFVKHYSATVLGNHEYGKNTLISSYNGKCCLRRIAGSALNKGESKSSNIWSDADAILLEINKNGFKKYSEEDAKLVYAFKKLKRK